MRRLGRHVVFSKVVCGGVLAAAACKGETEGAGTTTQTERAVTAGAVDLLDAPIPSDAVGLFAVRSTTDAIGWIRFMSPYAPMTDAEVEAMRRELDELFRKRIGMSLTEVQGATFVVRPGPKGEDPRVAAFIHGAKGDAVTGDKVGEHMGRDIVKLPGDEDIFAAAADGGLVLGFETPESLHSMLEVVAGNAPRLADVDGPFSKMLVPHRNGSFVFALDAGALTPEERAEVDERGVQRSVLAMADGALFWRCEGDADRLREFGREIEGWVAMGAMGVRMQSDDVDDMELLEAAGMIIGRHQADAFQRVIKPQMVDGGLELRLQMGALDAGIAAAVLGIGAAVAIPALSKYMRRAKASEARIQVAKLFDAVGAMALAHPRFQCPSNGDPAGTVGPTPPLSFDCNAGPGGRCVPTDAAPSVGEYPSSAWTLDPVWSALNYRLDDAHYFHMGYEWTNDETGCEFTVRAQGDLNGDGNFSLYERSGRVDANGLSSAEGLHIEGELE